MKTIFYIILSLLIGLIGIVFWVYFYGIIMPLYPFIKDIITAMISIGALVIAWKGLQTWKEQITGVKTYKVVYNLHYSILKLRNAIRYGRNPAIWHSESYKAIQYARAKYPNKSSEEIENDSHLYVYEMRWEEIKNASTEVESHLLGAEVLWGAEILELMKPLNRKITELNIALQQKFNPELRTKKTQEIFNIVYEGGEGREEDTFSKDVHEAIQKIADYMKSKL